ncbi:DUF7619 domain-containing protein [Chitinophagaceae bacterium MMS25-I14]
MRKKLLILLLASISSMANAQTVSIAITQAPCNHDGILTANFSGFTSPVTVQWNTTSGSVVHTGITGSTDVLTNYSGAFIYAYVTDGNNNTAYSSGISAPPFQLSMSTTSAVCPNLGSASVSVTGGTAPYSYQWYNSANNAAVGTNNPTVNVPNGSYYVSVTDANGCNFNSSEDSVQGSAYVYVSPGFTVTTASTVAACTNGTASVQSISGGVAPYSYLWTNGATSASITGLTMGSYGISVTDANGCTASTYQYVTQSVQISANTVVTPATCVQNNGSVTSFGSGGTPPYSYHWSNGSTAQSIHSLSAGSYTVNITDANGCMGSGYSYVTSTTPITATYSTTASSCTSPTGSAHLSLSGGTAPYTISWSSSPAQTGVNLSNVPPGNYNFHITDANGCVRNGTVNIPPAHIISANFTVTQPVCAQTNGSLHINASGGSTPYTYLWSNGATAATVNSIGAGSYSCTVTDNAGCSVTKSYAMTPSSPLVTGLATTPASCIFSNDGSITANVTGGTPPYTYTWNNGTTTATAGSLLTGNYWLTVTDAASCTATLFDHVGYNPAGTSCYCTISGTVYEDLNGNCVKDAGEAGIANIQIHCSGRGYTYTDSNGVYSFMVPSGTYTISETVLGQYPLAACQNNNVSVTAAASSGCSHTVNFANAVNPLHDVHISLWSYSGSNPVPGNTYTQLCVVKNDGTVSENGIISKYTNDGQLNGATFTPAGIFSASGNTYTSSTLFPVLAPGAAQSFLVDYAVPTNIPLNTSVLFADTASYTSPLSNWLNDYSPWNNVNYYTKNVLGSFDPNYKEVSPAGEGPTGKITRADSVLDYMVHFQNTGTWPAHNIVVTDTLDSDLDWSTLRPGYSSHPCKVSMSENGVVTFTFSNINLPTQVSNDKGSNGMFSYSIKTKRNLPYGTKFTNSAAIYFDYNDPVITNQTLNTLTAPADVPGITKNSALFNVYPNPASGTAHMIINNDAAYTHATVSITDISGRQMLAQEITLQSGNQSAELDISKLSSGIYFVNLRRANEISTQKLVVIH